MKNNNNSYCLPLDKVLSEKNELQRTILLRRITFNLKLANKFGFPVVLASFAKTEHLQRDPHLIRALAETLGLREDIAKVSMKKFK